MIKMEIIQELKITNVMFAEDHQRCLKNAYMLSFKKRKKEEN